MKQCISKVPNNTSSWNYLRGVLDYNKIPYSNLQSFITPYTVSRPSQKPEDEGDTVDLENLLPSGTAHLPSVLAIEFQADIYEHGGGENLTKAAEVRYVSLLSIIWWFQHNK